MNKDVIYIEAEDDITDIITKVEKSKEKIVALVPPKKAGVFRSVVNIKLIAKVGATNEKTIVLVTTDPSIVRLAATVKLPVTKNLQSAPMIPTIDSADDVAKAELVEVVEPAGSDDEGADESKEADDVNKNDNEETGGEEQNSEEETNEDAEDDEDLASSDGSDKDEEEPDDEDKKKTNAKNKEKKKSKEKKGGWIKAHKKRLIFGSVGLIALIGVLVWALVFAPAVDITVWIQTENKRFSEAVSFVNNLSEENAAEGKFYLEEKKIESVQEVKFEATGQKNRGERATGELAIMATISHKGGAKVINAGEIFTNNGLSFAADKSLTLSFDGEDTSVCANEDDKVKEFKEKGCQIYAKIKVTATAPGSAYNIGPTNFGWTTVSDLVVSSDTAMSGGTDDIVTVVQQSDIIKAKEQIASANEAENKEKLLSSINDDLMVLESTLQQSTSEAVATPGVDEEVKEGVTPVLKATTTASVLVIDKTKLKEFITAKANLGENQKIYEIEDPFLEGLSSSGSGYIARLKTSYSIGPKVSNKEVLELAVGKGIGEIQHDLKEIPGIVSVESKASYPWVMTVPKDINKVSVDIKVKDSSGKQNAQEKTETKEESSEETEQESKE